MHKDKKKYLIACSGGPDSMALLNMSKDKYEVFVCHINYHHRQTALRDEEIVKNYCLINKIPFIKFDYVDNEKGNFQDKARVFRYQCFEKCIKQYELDGVLVGHHLDDLLETYLLQIKRHSEVSYYGLKKKTKIFNVDVIRPLLKYSKKQLEDYCLKNNIPYGIDESNLTDAYQRNKIRHTKIEKMSKKDKQDLLLEINYKNYQKKEIDKLLNEFINKQNHFDYYEFMSCPYLKQLIRKLTYEDLSDKYLEEIIKALKSKKNIELKIKDKVLYKEYDYIEVWDKEVNYSYTFNSIKYQKYPYFKLSKKGSNFEGVTLDKNDFPITIRNFKEGDFIKMRYGSKKINRFFIDNKISTHQRKLWPIMFDKNGSAILVPEIGCNFNHFSIKHNAFMIKLD